MNDHAMIGERKSSLAVTCKRLLEDNIRVHRVKSYTKYSKLPMRYLGERSPK